MQAAQLAAEAAMQEAAREASGGGRSSSNNRRAERQHHDSEIDMDSSNTNIGMDPEQLSFLKAMQAAEMGGQSNMMSDLGVTGLGNSSNNSVQSLLKMLSQQEQDNHRPEEHYLTIAQNGKVTRNGGCVYNDFSLLRISLECLQV